MNLRCALTLLLWRCVHLADNACDACDSVRIACVIAWIFGLVFGLNTQVGTRKINTFQGLNHPPKIPTNARFCCKVDKFTGHVMFYLSEGTENT